MTINNGTASPAEGECTAGFSEQIDRLLVDEELAPRKMARLRDHVAGCDACRVRYNKIMLASRLFHGGPEALTQPSSGEVDRVRQQLFAPRVRLVPDPPLRRRLLRFALGLAAAGAAAAVVLPIVMNRDTQPIDSSGRGELQARGAADRSKLGSTVGLRALCILRAGGMRDLGGANSDRRCGLGDKLTFVYTNNPAAKKKTTLSYLAIVGVDERFGVDWYWPRNGPSGPAKNGVIDEPSGKIVRLQGQRAGLLRVFALFSSAPITAQELAQAARRASVAGSIETAKSLKLDSKKQRGSTKRIVEQRSVLIELMADSPDAHSLRLDGPGKQRPREN